MSRRLLACILSLWFVVPIGCATVPTATDEPTAPNGARWQADVDLPPVAQRITAGTFHTCALQTDRRVDCWGIGGEVSAPDGTRWDYGQADPPDAEMTDLTAGGFHTCGLRPDDGRATCWGRDDFGQSTPPEGRFAALDAGGFHTCGLRPDGSVDCWGLGSDADATEVSSGEWPAGEEQRLARANHPIDADQSIPVDGSFVEVSAGAHHTCARRENGGVDCWGRGTDGGAADPPEAEFARVDAGLETTCGVTDDGQLTCWGARRWKEVTDTNTQPIDSVSLGHDHICVRRESGDAYCYGSVAESLDESLPDVAEVAAGAFHGCSRSTHGRVDCSGLGLGDPEPARGDLRQAMPPDFTRYDLLSVGAHQSCARTSTYSGQSSGEPRWIAGGKTDFKCWRGNMEAVDEARAEYLHDGGDEDPTDMGFSIVSGGRSTCLDFTDGEHYPSEGIACWDARADADDPGLRTHLIKEIDTLNRRSFSFEGIGVGGAHRCMQTSTRGLGLVYCWGKGSKSGVWEGTGDYNQARPMGTRSGYFHMSERSTCVRRKSSMTCWGDTSRRRFDAEGGFTSVAALGPHHGCWLEGERVVCTGVGSRPHRDEGEWDFNQATPPDGDFLQLAAGRRYTCGIRAGDRSVDCWGDNSHGQLDPPDARFVALDAATLAPDDEGYGWTCGVTVDQRVLCWGARPDNLAEEPEPETPGRPEVKRLGTIASLHAGDVHTCAIDEHGRAACWGKRAFGQADVPDGEQFRSLAAGISYTCGLRDDATVTCWGRGLPRINPNALALSGGIGASQAPVAPPGGRFARLAGGRLHACAVGFDGGIVCWGRNREGQCDAPEAADFVDVAAGTRFSCGLQEDGAVDCWGGGRGAAPSPPEGGFSEIAAGHGQICGIRTDGGIACWGTTRGTPPESGTYVELSVGRGHACARRADGRVDCWGEPAAVESEETADFGQTDAPDGDFQQITTGARHACGVRPDGSAVCWGLGTDLDRQESDADYNQGVTPSGKIRGQ